MNFVKRLAMGRTGPRCFGMLSCGEAFSVSDRPKTWYAAVMSADVKFINREISGRTLIWKTIIEKTESLIAACILCENFATNCSVSATTNETNGLDVCVEWEKFQNDFSESLLLSEDNCLSFALQVSGRMWILCCPYVRQLPSSNNRWR